MKNIRFLTIVGQCCIISQTVFAQPLNLVLDQPETGNQTHQARNSITFAPGYSYTPNGGTMLAEIVNPLIGSDIVFDDPINPDSYSINTSLAVGKTSGVLHVGGSAGYTVPLDLPKGSAGLQPVLSLAYNSNYVDGTMGVGWNIGGLSSITRINESIYFDGKSDPVRGDLTDKYALDGKRLIVITGTYGEANSEYRSEIEEFSKIVAYGSTGKGPDWFKVYTKSGLIYEYGHTPDSKVNSDNGYTLSWKLNKISDRYNNYITFNYLTSEREQPIGYIEYTGNSSLSQAPFAEIVFNYKRRDDVSQYVYGGQLFTRNILLDNIEINNNGQPFKKYVLNYMKDTHAQLQKVTEYSSQGVAINPTVFTWSEQTEQFTQTTHYTGSTTWELYYTGDFNGDGREDLVVVPNKTSYTSSDKWKLYLADANGNMVYETEGNLNSSFETFLVGDFNGDGLTDLMMQQNAADSQYPNKKHYYFYQSTGETFSRSSSYYLCYNNERLDVVDYNGDGKLEFMFHNTANSWYLYTYSGQSIYSASIPSFGEYYIIDIGMHNRILDFNGDGCSDLLVLFSNGYKVYEFKGTNNILVETYSGNNIANNDFLLFGDYNGDGTTDMIKVNSISGNWSMLFLTADGFQEHNMSCFDKFNINTSNNRIYARDMNADGRTDVVLVGRGTNTGNSYNRINVAISTGNDFNITEHISSTTMQYDSDLYFNFGDFNGDGRYQLFYKYGSTSKLFSFASGTPSHLVSTIIDGFGGRNDLTYLPMSNSNVYSRGSGAAYPLNDFSSSVQLVSQVTGDNGIGGTTTMSYQYAGAKVHRHGKGFLGFSQVTATNSATGISTESHYEFDGTYYFPKLRYVYTKHGSTTLSTTSNTWNVTSLGGKRIFPYVSPGVQTDNLTGLSVTTTVSYNSYGNPTTIASDYGGGHTQTTTYAYNDENVSSWLIGRPTIITETSVRDSQTKTFTTTRTYFSSSNMPDIDQYNPGDTAWWKLDREYDTFGNLWKEHVETTGLNTQTTIYRYDNHGVKLENVTNPIGNETSYTYYPATGLLHTETDPFGNTTTYSYNTSDQLHTITPDQGVSTTVTGSLNVSGGPANARYYIQEAGDDGSRAKTWYDKLGRELRAENRKLGGDMVKTDKQYNAKGQVARISEPTTGTPSHWNAPGYDDYGRVTSQDPYFGPTTTFSYQGATTSRTVNGRNYTSTIDGAGLVTGRTDPGGTITYNYWPDGSLKSTLAPGNATTSMEYDKNGNRLTINDPSAGLIKNRWYGTGQPKTYKNARNQVTTYDYQTDGLLDKYTDAEGETDYSYNSDGQVINITSPRGVTRSYTYDTRGRVETVSETIGGVSFTTTFSYDSKGRLYRKYFNGSDYEQYDYDTNSGYLYRITFNGSTVWEATTIDEYSRMRAANIGTTAATWGYNSTTNLLSQVKGTGVQQYDYSFNGNTGNLESRTNYLKSKTESFGYDTDNLDRLASVTGPSAQTLTYTTNKNGNILTKSDAGTYSYDETPYAVSGITNALNIDTARQEIEYYSFEKVKKITESGKTAEFFYNADGQRIRMTLKDNGTVTKTRWYFGSSYEREQAGSTVTQYIWIGGDAYTAVAVAKKVGTGSWVVYNIFRDHLGTITHLKNGSTIYEYSFDAWGRRRDKDTWSYTLSGEPGLFAGRGFTAHEHLEDFTLINMNGRLYDPVVGRFLSPDPYVQAPDFSQNFNRYSYCINNPLKYTDPDGENPLAFIIGAIVGAYLGGTATNDWQWNPGKWDYKDPATYFGIVGGGLAGGLGAQWMFGPGGVLAGGTAVDVSVGLTANNAGAAFANFSFGEGAGLVFEGLGYATIAGGGAYLTAQALNSLFDGNTPPSTDQTVISELNNVRQAYGNAWYANSGEIGPEFSGSFGDWANKINHLGQRKWTDPESGMSYYINDGGEITGIYPITGMAPTSGFAKGSKFYIQLTKQLSKDGSKSVIRSYNSIQRRLLEHQSKLPHLRYKSSVEREIRTFQEQLKILKEFMKNHGIQY